MTGFLSLMMLHVDSTSRTGNMKTGLSSYTYTWAVGVAGSMPAVPLKAEDIIDRASEAGLGLVQIADNLPLEKWPEEKLKALRRYGGQKNVMIEMGGRGMIPDHTFSCLIAAEILGSPVLRMVIDGPDFEPGINEINAIIRDILPELKSRNIKLAIENHDRLKAREFEEIILDAGSELVGICLDSVNSMGAGEGFEEVARILLPYTINFHIKDFTIRRVSHKMGIIIEGAPAGKGMLNISEVVNRLNETGQCDSAILELWTPPEQDIESTIIKENNWAQESIEYLKNVIN